jgi:hypothetical protein
MRTNFVASPMLLIVKEFRKTSVWRLFRDSGLWGYLYRFQLVRRVAKHFAGEPALFADREHVESLLSKLQAEGHRFVVLRWFSESGRIDMGSDIDILVDDRDIHRMRKYFSLASGRQRIRVDLYSESGLTAFGEQVVAYYPPRLAASLLDKRRTLENGIPAPRQIDYFHSLAYHAVYHKGLDSGLPVTSGCQQNPEIPAITPRGKFADTLRTLAREIDVDVQLTLPDLKALLASVGWSPSFDLMQLLARKNIWLEEQLLIHESSEHLYQPDDIVVAIIREANSHVGQVNKILRTFESNGFRNELCQDLSLEKQREFQLHTRGGNWPSRDGGPPSVLLVFSKRGANAAEVQHEVRLVKDYLRRCFVRDRMSFPSTVLHTSDTPGLAVAYLRLLLGTGTDDLLRERFR